MLNFRPTVFISHSERFKEEVAIPFRDHIRSLGMTAILVSEMPTPEGGAGEPDSKVDYYLDRSEMFVALMTPDDHTKEGEVHARPNVTDEIARARARDHLRERVQVFKAAEVDLHSNINPTYEALDPTDVAASFAVFERQAAAWEILEVSPAPPAEAAPAVGPIGPSDAGSPHPAGRAGAPRAQAARAVEELRRSLLDADGDPVMPSPLARAHLAASVALAGVRSISTFGVHELNGLYREREALRLSAEEKRHLMRTMVLHIGDENAPGWYWFRDRRAGDLHGELVELAREDPDLSVRTRSLDLLARTTEKIGAAEFRRVIAAGLKEGGGVRAAALRLLGARGNTRLLGTLREELQGADTAEAMLTVRARHAPGAALRELERRPLSHGEEAEKRLLEAAGRLPLASLRRGLRGGDPRIRALCLRALSRSSRLRRADVIGLVEIGSAAHGSARRRCGSAWHAGGASIARCSSRRSGIPGSAIRRCAICASTSTAGVRCRSSWESSSGSARARWDRPSTRRSPATTPTPWRGGSAPISTRTSPHYATPGTRMSRRRSSATSRPGSRGWTTAGGRAPSRSGPWSRRGFRSSSANTRRSTPSPCGASRRPHCGLLAHGEAGDARFARRFLASDDMELQDVSVALVARFGEACDEDALLGIAGNAYSDQAGRAAEAALAVSSDVPATVDRLIETGKPGLTLIAVGALANSSIEDAVPRLMPLLDDEADAVRRVAAGALGARLPTDKGRRALLGHYLSTGNYYYYNVVVALDRTLWAPGWLRAATREER